MDSNLLSLELERVNSMDIMLIDKGMNLWKTNALFNASIHSSQDKSIIMSFKFSH